MWEICLQGKVGVLSRDTGKQLTIPHCDWNMQLVPRSPACLVVMFPKKTLSQCPLLSIMQCTIPAAIPCFSPTALYYLTLLGPGQPIDYDNAILGHADLNFPLLT